MTDHPIAVSNVHELRTLVAFDDWPSLCAANQSERGKSDKFK